MTRLTAFIVGAVVGVTSIGAYIVWLAAEADRREEEQRAANYRPFYDMLPHDERPGWSWRQRVDPDLRLSPTRVVGHP